MSESKRIEINKAVQQMQELNKDKEHWRNLYREECEKNKKLSEENKLIKYYKSQHEEMKYELKKKTELIRYYKKILSDNKNKDAI